MEERTFGYKEGEGINFSRAAKHHDFGNMDGDEFMNTMEDLSKKGQADKLVILKKTDNKEGQDLEKAA